ncbi:MAG: PGPGW domain-containing protein [Proteobacteria bacterium]|nr:PGPGW domain-containing protein [Pseudomonadota bacterium]
MDAPERPLWLIWLRRIGVVLAGGAVLVIGIAMIVLPGPAIVMIPVGLAILGLEFAWARRWLRKARARGRLLTRRRKRSR